MTSETTYSHLKDNIRKKLLPQCRQIALNFEKIYLFYFS